MNILVLFLDLDFRCYHASLYEGLSVYPSISLLVYVVATAPKRDTEAYREAEKVANLEGEGEGEEEDQKTGGMLKDF